MHPRNIVPLTNNNFPKRQFECKLYFYALFLDFMHLKMNKNKNVFWLTFYFFVKSR